VRGGLFSLDTQNDFLHAQRWKEQFLITIKEKTMRRLYFLGITVVMMLLFLGCSDDKSNDIKVDLAGPWDVYKIPDGKIQEQLPPCFIVQSGESITVKDDSHGEGVGAVHGLQLSVIFGDRNGTHETWEGTVRDDQQFISGTYVQYLGGAVSQRGTCYLVRNDSDVDITSWVEPRMYQYYPLKDTEVFKIADDHFLVASKEGELTVTRPDVGDSDDTDIYSPYMDPTRILARIDIYDFKAIPAIVSGSGLLYVIGQRDDDEKIKLYSLAFRNITDEYGELSLLEEYYLPGNDPNDPSIIGTVDAAVMYDDKLFLCSDVYVWEFVRSSETGRFVYVKHEKLDPMMKMPLSMIVFVLDEKPALVIGGYHNDSDERYFLQTLDFDFKTIQTNDEYVVNDELEDLKILNLPCNDLSDNTDAFIVITNSDNNQWRVENFDKTSDGKNFYCNDSGEIEDFISSSDIVLAHTVTVDRDGGDIDVYVNSIMTYGNYTRAVRFKTHYLKRTGRDKQIDTGADRVRDYGTPFGVVYGAPPQVLNAEQKEFVLKGDGHHIDGRWYSNIRMLSSTTEGKETGWQNTSTSTTSTTTKLFTVELFSVDFSITDGLAKTYTDFTTSTLTQYIYAADSLGYVNGTILTQVPSSTVVYKRKYEIKKDADTPFNADKQVFVEQQYIAANANSVPTTVDFSLGDSDNPVCPGGEFDLIGMMGAPRTLDIEAWTGELFDFLNARPPGKQSYNSLASIVEFSTSESFDYSVTSGTGVVKSSSTGSSASVGLGPQDKWVGGTIGQSGQLYTQSLSSEETMWGVSYHPINGSEVDVYSITVLMLDPYVVRQAGRDCFWISDDMNKRGFAPWCIIYMIDKDE
jgi:hypothetical protein